MLKRILFLLLLFIFLTQNFIFADEIDDEEIDLNTIETSANINELPKISSRNVLVLERSTETVLFEKNGYTKTPMASTTKIMTATIAIENCKLTDEVEISSKAAHTGGSTLGITSNTKLSMQTLLYGLLMRSRK